MKQWFEMQQEAIENTHQSLVQAKAEFFLSSNYVKHAEDFPYISQRYNEMTRLIEEVLNWGMYKKKNFNCSSLLIRLPDILFLL